jgi:hypothetical protein
MKTKKELKELYKQMKFPIGVFQIRNIANNKIFLGSSVNLSAVWNSLQFQLNLGTYPNNELQAEWKKFGENSFVFEILCEIKQDDSPDRNYKKEAEELKELFMAELQPFGNKGYH